MRKNIDIPKGRIEKFLEQFYNYFETGYEFEEFLKIYLEQIGLDEVIVTQRSSDGGIDLEAQRYGVGNLDESDAVKYYVQAKRNKPNSTVPIEKIRALRGVMPSGSKGIFISTSRFSKKTEEFVKEDASRPIILIDGERLVESCIDLEIGFVYTPVFSISAMDDLKRTHMIIPTEINESTDNNAPIITVSKDITTNDIRARILRFPKAIIDKVPNDQKTMEITFEGIGIKKLNIDKSRCFLSGITEVFREKGLIEGDGVYNARQATWRMFSDGKIEIVI